MLVLSLGMIPLLVAPLLFELSNPAEDAVVVADWSIWAIFALELGLKTWLAPARRTYLRKHWFDVLIVVLPFLRPLRVIRSARALRLLRATRLTTFAARALHSTRSILAEHGLQYVLLVGVVVVLASAGLVTVFERGAGGTINDLDDGLWWAVTTITTVGYGDKVPVTPEGRGIAMFLMLLGVGLFGVITANLAAFLVSPKEDKNAASIEELIEHVKLLEGKIEGLNPPDVRS